VQGPPLALSVGAETHAVRNSWSKISAPKIRVSVGAMAYQPCAQLAFAFVRQGLALRKLLFQRGGPRYPCETTTMCEAHRASV